MTAPAPARTPAQDFFEPWQVEVEDWAGALEQINLALRNATSSRTLAWRGVTDATYSLHSSLYRRLVAASGAPPLEKDLLNFERSYLERARRVWRFDNLSALELLAHIQHYGGPTRLLDVSFNPLVALWFAVERKHDKMGRALPDTDGRMFAFDTTGRQIDLTGAWADRELPWETPPTTGWQTDLPLVWRPPSYNDRIPAQNSAFLLGGSPKSATGSNRPYRKEPGAASTMGLWKIKEVRAATSVNIRMNALDRALPAGSTPTYTLLIKASGKEAIRQSLEDNFGLNGSTVYPDLLGLATHGSHGL